MKDARSDRDLDALLDLDGYVFVVDPQGNYWVKFMAHRIPATADRPYGIRYSLTLHDASGKPSAGNRAVVLIQECGSATGGLLERGRQRPPREGSPVTKVLKVGIASYDEMKARTRAIVRGAFKPGATEPKVWFRSAESFAKVLSEKNRALLNLIAESSPGSLAELAQRSGRKKSNLSRTLRTMERYGFVVLKKGERGGVVPRVPYQSISLVLPLVKTVKKRIKAA